MGVVLNQVDESVLLDVNVVKSEMVLRAMDLPYVLTLVGTEEGTVLYTFAKDDVDYSLTWVDGVFIIEASGHPGLDQTAVVVYNQEQETTHTEFLEAVTAFTTMVNQWVQVIRIPLVSQNPDTFHMGDNPSSVIVIHEGFRYDLHFHNGAALYARALDTDMLEEGVEYENEADSPLMATNPYPLHPVMGGSFMSYLADQLGVEDADAILDPLGQFLDPHYGETK